MYNFFKRITLIIGSNLKRSNTIIEKNVYAVLKKNSIHARAMMYNNNDTLLFSYNRGYLFFLNIFVFTIDLELFLLNAEIFTGTFYSIHQ